jgi:hypothetical protein
VTKWKAHYFLILSYLVCCFISRSDYLFGNQRECYYHLVLLNFDMMYPCTEHTKSTILALGELRCYKDLFLSVTFFQVSQSFGCWLLRGQWVDQGPWGDLMDPEWVGSPWATHLCTEGTSLPHPTVICHWPSLLFYFLKGFVRCCFKQSEERELSEFL